MEGDHIVLTEKSKEEELPSLPFNSLSHHSSGNPIEHSSTITQMNPPTIEEYSSDKDEKVMNEDEGEREEEISSEEEREKKDESDRENEEIASSLPPYPTKESLSPHIEITKSMKEYDCQICLETHLLYEERGYDLYLCHHIFCRECIKGYLSSKILDGQIHPKCFYIMKNKRRKKDTSSSVGVGSSSSSSKQVNKTGLITDAIISDSSSILDDNDIIIGDKEDDDNVIEEGEVEVEEITCNEEICNLDILELLHDNQTLCEKYKRYKYCKDNPNARECPYCGIFNLGDPLSPKIICTKCEKIYCYIHSNAHDFIQYPTCEEYDKHLAVEIKESEDLISRESKPCPNCKMMIMKSGGCNHMKCSCGTAFCWLCGKEIDDDIFPVHFQWWNPNGCSNLQMNQAITPSIFVRILAWIVTILQFLILGPITFLSTCISSCCCCICIYSQLHKEIADGTNKASNRRRRDRTRERMTIRGLPNLSPIEQTLDRENSNSSSSSAVKTGWNCFSSPMMIALRAYLANCMSGWGYFWMTILFLVPILLAGGGLGIGVVIAVVLITYPCYACGRLYRRRYPWPDIVTEVSRDIYDSIEHCCCSRCCPRRLATTNYRYQQPIPSIHQPVFEYADSSSVLDIEMEGNKEDSISLFDKKDDHKNDINVTSMQTRLDRMLQALEQMEGQLEQSQQKSKNEQIPEEFKLDKVPQSDITSSSSIQSNDIIRDLSEESNSFNEIRTALTTLLSTMMNDSQLLSISSSYEELNPSDSVMRSVVEDQV